MILEQSRVVAEKLLHDPDAPINRASLIDHEGVVDTRTIRAFASGATRDTAEGKYAIEAFLSPEVLLEFSAYMHTHRFQSDGSVRTGDNWMNGISLDAYMDSFIRHAFDLWAWHRGVPIPRPEDGKVPTVEDSLGALLFAVMGIWFETIRGRQTTDTFVRPKDKA